MKEDMKTVQEVIDELMKIEDKSQILYINIPCSNRSMLTPKFEIEQKDSCERLLKSHRNKLILYPFF